MSENTNIFMDFWRHHLPFRANYVPSSQLKQSSYYEQYSWQKALRRAASWLFMGVLVGAAVFAGMYLGGAPLLILSSGFYYAMAGASSATFVGVMVYADVLRDRPNQSHQSRFFYYLRMLTASCLLVPIMVLGAKLLPALYGLDKAFTVAEGLLGSTQVHFMLKSLMGIACGIMFVGQSLSMMFIALSHRAKNKGWTYFNAKRLRIAGKSLSMLCTFGLAGVATQVIPVAKGSWKVIVLALMTVAALLCYVVIPAAIAVITGKRMIQASKRIDGTALFSQIPFLKPQSPTKYDTTSQAILPPCKHQAVGYPTSPMAR